MYHSKIYYQISIVGYIYHVLIRDHFHYLPYIAWEAHLRTKKLESKGLKQKIPTSPSFLTFMSIHFIWDALTIHFQIHAYASWHEGFYIINLSTYLKDNYYAMRNPRLLYKRIGMYFSPLLFLQLASPLRTCFASVGSSLLASHRCTILLQSLTLVVWSDSTWGPSILEISYALSASFLAASVIAFPQVSSQHSFTRSILPQAASRLDESTVLSNSWTSLTGQEPSVRFSGWREHICCRVSLAPWLTRSCWKSERQCFARVPFKASIFECLLDLPIRITRVVSTWGQHMTLARYSANGATQSSDVTAIILFTASKFSVQSPAEGEKKSKRIQRILKTLDPPEVYSFSKSVLLYVLFYNWWCPRQLAHTSTILLGTYYLPPPGTKNSAAPMLRQMGRTHLVCFVSIRIWTRVSNPWCFIFWPCHF